MTAEPPPPQHDEDRPTFIRSFLVGLRSNWPTYTMFVLMVMSLAAIVVAITGINAANESNVRLQRLVECQNRYNEINNERTRQLAESAVKENYAEVRADDALLATVTSIVSRSEDRQKQVEEALETLKKRLDEQKTARAETNQDRLEHPVPPPPAALCGDVSTK